MSEKRLRFTMESDKLYSCIFDNGNELTCFELVDLLNKLYEENEQLKIRLLNCEQKKNDNGGFQVWEVPPIPQGKRISFTTNDGGDGV